MKKMKILSFLVSCLLIWWISYGNMVWFTHASSANITLVTTKIPYQEKLDAFLVKVANMKTQLDDTKYENLLNSISKQLWDFSQKYASNTTLSQMITYLNDGVKKLQYDLNGNVNVDNFLCQLLWNCWDESTPSCTTQYDPVCAQPPMPKCSDNPMISCMQVMPEPKTYSNSCQAGLEKATFLYKWECKIATSSSSSSSSSGWNGQSCSGTLPPSWAGVNVRPFTNIVAWPDTNTTWKYSNGGERCTWSCKTWYTLNAAKNNCETKSAGSGITVYVYDNATKQPISWVWVDIIGIIGMSSSIVGSYVTDASGKTQEDFSPASGMWNILQIKKSGYSIASASGCTPRVTGGNVYCDSIKMENSVVKIYLQTGTRWTPSTKVGNSMSNLSSNACANQIFYVVTDGVDKSNPPKGCARAAGTSSCTNPADFRDYTANEWSGNNRIISTGQANQFPVGNYEFFALYGNQIISAGSASLSNCAGGVSPGTPTTRIGNSMNNLSTTACANQPWYAVVDWVDRANPPKGCARLAGTSSCTNLADFRDYKADEWSGNNRIVSSGQANEFPVANYEFFAAYGNQIVSAGSATLINCPTTTTPTNSCKWQYHAVFGPVWPLDINPNSTSCTSSLNGRSAYEVSGSKQKVATCACS